MGLVSVMKQTPPSLGKSKLQTLIGGKPTRKLQDILSILLISIISTAVMLFGTAVTLPGIVCSSDPSSELWSTLFGQ